jgi:hypothetical protein
MPKCACNNPAARDCDNGQCGACCLGCNRHEGEPCQTCNLTPDECCCEPCNYSCCDTMIEDGAYTQCSLCGRLCDEHFGEGYTPLGGDLHCETCGEGLKIGGSDNSPDEW